MPGNVTIQTAEVPEGTCPPWLPQKWPELVALLSASLNGGNNVFNVGSSTPAPADQDKPWLKSTAAGYPDGQYWLFNAGFWLKQHPLKPGMIIMWEGDISAINAFDGGESAAVSLITGPMWEVVTELQGRFPIGAGQDSSTSTNFANGSEGGEETHELTINEMPAHSHRVNAAMDSSGGSGGNRLREVTDPDNATTTSQDTGGGEAHNNLPPYRALHFIRRTAREYYRA